MCVCVCDLSQPHRHSAAIAGCEVVVLLDSELVRMDIVSFLSSLVVSVPVSESERCSSTEFSFHSGLGSGYGHCFMSDMGFGFANCAIVGPRTRLRPGVSRPVQGLNRSMYVGSCIHHPCFLDME